MYIAYRVMPLPDIRRVVRVKTEKRKRWLTREVVLETGQDAIKSGKRGGKDDGRHREGSRSIIAETGNILTGGRT